MIANIKKLDNNSRVKANYTSNDSLSEILFIQVIRKSFKNIFNTSFYVFILKKGFTFLQKNLADNSFYPRFYHVFFKFYLLQLKRTYIQFYHQNFYVSTYFWEHYTQRIYFNKVLIIFSIGRNFLDINIIAISASSFKIGFLLL